MNGPTKPFRWTGRSVNVSQSTCITQLHWAQEVSIFDHFVIEICISAPLHLRFRSAAALDEQLRDLPQIPMMTGAGRWNDRIRWQRAVDCRVWSPSYPAHSRSSNPLGGEPCEGLWQIHAIDIGSGRDLGRGFRHANRAAHLARCSADTAMTAQHSLIRS